MTARRTRGAQRLAPRDWLFGSRPRRRLLDALLVEGAVAAPTTKTELAKLAGVGANGGVDELVTGLVHLNLLVEVGRRWQPVDGPLVHDLTALCRSLRAVDDQVPPAAPPAEASAVARGPGHHVQQAKAAVEQMPASVARSKALSALNQAAAAIRQLEER